MEKTTKTTKVLLALLLMALIVFSMPTAAFATVEQPGSETLTATLDGQVTINSGRFNKDDFSFSGRCLNFSGITVTTEIRSNGRLSFQVDGFNAGEVIGGPNGSYGEDIWLEFYQDEVPEQDKYHLDTTVYTIMIRFGRTSSGSVSMSVIHAPTKMIWHNRVR